MNSALANNTSVTDELWSVYEPANSQHWSQFPAASWQVCYVWGSLLSVIGVVGVSGNGIVLFLFTRFRRLRGPFSCFIVNLATADFCSSIIHFMSVSSCFCQRWLYGNLGCRFYAFSIGLLGLVSIVTLSTIAVERYIVITSKPFSGSWKITQCGAKRVCLGVWVYCAAMVLPPLFGWSSFVPEGFMTSCSWDYLTRTPWNRAYYIYLLTLGFVIPIVVITYCYIFILAAIIAHSREMENVKSVGDNTSLNYSLNRGTTVYMNSNDSTRAQTLTWTSSNVRSAEIILMLILLFTIAWLPYAVVTIIGQFGDAQLITPWVAALPGLFAKTSVMCNPFIYGLSHPHFRSSWRQYLSSCATGLAAHAPTSLVSIHHRNPSRRITSSPVAFDLPLRRTYSSPHRPAITSSKLAVNGKDSSECQYLGSEVTSNSLPLRPLEIPQPENDVPEGGEVTISVPKIPGGVARHRDIIRIRKTQLSLVHNFSGSPV